MLKVSHLRVAYGYIEALHGVSIDIEPGEAVALLGANGSGKSTLIRACCGLLPARAGLVTFEDTDLASRKLHQVIRLGISYALEGRRTFAQLTVLDNLVLGAYVDGGLNTRTRPRFDFAMSVFPMLSAYLNRPAGLLSGGQRQMLAVAQALMSGPKLLILDEPSAGLAPQLVSEMFAALQRLKESGMALLLAEQAVAQALTICDRGYVLMAGNIAMQDTADGLAANSEIRVAYMGTFGSNEDVSSEAYGARTCSQAAQPGRCNATT